MKTIISEITTNNSNNTTNTAAGIIIIIKIAAQAIRSFLLA